MLYIEIQGDKRVIGILDQAEKRIGNTKKALSDIGEVAISEFKQNFPAEGRYLGEPWKPLAKSTIKERMRKGYGAHPILVRTGRLMNGFRKEVQKFQVRVHNTTPYYQYHQLGGGFLPQRRMILTPEKFKQAILATLRNHFRDIFKR